MILSKLSLKRSCPSARGIELSNGHRWPANNHDLMCVSLSHTVALWPSKLSQFFFSFSNWNMPQRVKDWHFSLHSWIYCFLSTISDGPVNHHPCRGRAHSKKVSLNTKHQAFLVVYLHFFSLLILVCTTCKLMRATVKNIFSDWNLTFPSNDLEQITYSLIMRNKMISATMSRKNVFIPMNSSHLQRWFTQCK